LRHKLFLPNGRFCPSIFQPPAPRMSFISVFSDFTVSTSFQLSSTAKQRFLQLYDKSCTSPFLSLPSMLAELRASLGGCQSLLASLTETPHLLFSTSMLLDKSRPLNSAVLTDQARDLAWAITFTRSKPGCGTLAGSSLESAGFLSQKLKGYADSPGLKRPGALQKPKMPGSVLLTRHDMHIVPYTWYLPVICTNS
jgi:hypothetical protein